MYGANTEVGKTVVTAGLLRAAALQVTLVYFVVGIFQQLRPACQWSCDTTAAGPAITAAAAAAVIDLRLLSSTRT